MGFDKIQREIELTARSGSRTVKFEIDDNETIELVVPPSVYPPRRDTRLMLDGLRLLNRDPGHLVEIGTGSGAIAIAMAKRGWRVSAFDVNPLAVAASRGNAETNRVSHLMDIEEGGVGEEDWKIPDGADIVAWNLPYLEPVLDEEISLGPLEEAALGEEPNSNWSQSLLDGLGESTNENRVFVLLFRLDPKSPSRPEDWLEQGWASRCLVNQRIGHDTLYVMAIWKPASGRPESFIKECDSTMDAARDLSGEGWLRLRAGVQNSGRGRQSSAWVSSDEDLTATWSLEPSILDLYSPGLIQTAVGASLADTLSMEVKWPNDLIFEGRKAGGILVESSSLDRRVRIGVGLNRRPRELDGVSTAGWSETVGEIKASEVFQRVDAAIASLFDSNPPIPKTTPEQLRSESWRAMARSLSRGVVCESGATTVRIVGLEESGALQLIDDAQLGQTDDVGELLIAF